MYALIDGRPDRWTQHTFWPQKTFGSCLFLERATLTSMLYQQNLTRIFDQNGACGAHSPLYFSLCRLTKLVTRARFPLFLQLKEVPLLPLRRSTFDLCLDGQRSEAKGICWTQTLTGQCFHSRVAFGRNPDSALSPLPWFYCRWFYCRFIADRF